MASDSGFALVYNPEGYTFQRKIMGRQAAGLGFVRAVAQASLPRVWCYSQSRALAAQLAKQLAELGAKKTGVAWVPSLQPARLASELRTKRGDVMRTGSAMPIVFAA